MPVFTGMTGWIMDIYLCDAALSVFVYTNEPVLVSAGMGSQKKGA
jgi:hypothetical protein